MGGKISKSRKPPEASALMVTWIIPGRVSQPVREHSGLPIFFRFNPPHPQQANPVTQRCAEGRSRAERKVKCVCSVFENPASPNQSRLYKRLCGASAWDASTFLVGGQRQFETPGRYFASALSQGCLRARVGQSIGCQSKRLDCRNTCPIHPKIIILL